MTPEEAQRVRRVEWDGHEITLYFAGQPEEPYGEREFIEGTHTRRLFHALEDAIGGIVRAYEAVEGL